MSTVDCGTGGCPCVGSVLVTAYACLTPSDTPGPIADDAPVLSALVTKPLRRGTALGFRFYPHDENYLSVHASAVTFTLSTDIPAGSALTLLANSGTPSAGMELFSRPPAGAPARPAWPGALVGRAGSRPAVGVYFSVFVYWSPSLSRVEGISALGVVTTEPGFLRPEPVLPPPSAVPCKYAFAVRAPSGLNFVYSLARPIPGTWRQAWRVLKWDTLSMWVRDVGVGAYATNVAAMEDARYVELQPGQLAALAYKPYDYAAAPAFSGQLVLVVTELVPAGTVAYIRGGPWPPSNATPARDMAHWVWTAPSACALLPGTVIDVGGLRPGSTGTVNIGTMTAGGAPVDLTDSFFAYTVFSAAPPASPEFSDFMAVTGVYPCSYTDVVPRELVPGVSILSQPWPDCAAILSLPCCNTVDNWPCFVLQLQHACATRWLCQPLPTFGASPCGACGGGCGSSPCCSASACASSRTPYASFPATARAAAPRPCCGVART